LTLARAESGVPLDICTEPRVLWTVVGVRMVVGVMRPDPAAPPGIDAVVVDKGFLLGVVDAIQYRL
jgi:hypothetical protein